MAQVGRGASGAFDFVESALEGLMQVWRYVFSSQEQDDIYTSIDSALMKEVKIWSSRLRVSSSGISY